MRVKVVGESASAAALRGYLKQAGDVAVWKDGDGEPDYTVCLEESSGVDFYFDSVPCEFERALLRHVREKSSVPISLHTAGGIRSDHAVRIVFPPSQAGAVEIGVQMGFADFAAPKHRPEAVVGPQPNPTARLEDLFEELVEKIHSGDSENIDLLEKLEDLYERLLQEKDGIILEKGVLVEDLQSQLAEMRKPPAAPPAQPPWWQFWKRFDAVGAIIILVLLALLVLPARSQTGSVNLQGIHSSSTPTLGSNQYAPLQLDASGNLIVNCGTGCSASSGPSFGSAFPATGTAIGFIGNTGNLTGGTLDASGNLKIDCALGCSGAADTTATGNLAAGGNTVSIAMAGVNSASFTLPSGNNLSAILTPEASTDGGTTWTATYLRNANAGFWAATLTVSSTAGAFNILVPGGASNVRIRVSTYTSGAANSTVVRGVSQPEAAPISTGTPGNAAPPYGAQMAGTDGTNLRALSTDSSGRPNTNTVNWGGSALGAPSNYGTSPGAVTVPGVNAFITNTPTVTANAGSGTFTVGGTVTANAGSGTFNIQSNASVNLAQVNGVALGSPSNYGTSPGAVSVPGVNAFITNTPTVNQGTSPWVDSVTTWGGGTLGAMANYGTSPGAVLVPGVNSFVTNTVTVSGTVTANQGTNPWTDQGALSNNGAAASTNRIGTLPGIAQTSYNNGTASTQGRDVALNVGTDGLLWTAALPSMRPASYTASSKFAASSTTDNSCMPGNATNTVLVTELRISGIQTTAGILNAEIVKRSAADTGGTSANMTVVPDDSNYAAGSSQPVTFTSTGPSAGAAVGDIDNVEVGFMAAATAAPNDIVIENWRQKPIVLRGTAQNICVALGGAVTGGNMSLTWKWLEVTSITP